MNRPTSEITSDLVNTWRFGPKKAIEKFWERVNKNGPIYNNLGPCWEWTGAMGLYGYGLVRMKRAMCRAHRIAWLSVNGDIPEGLSVLHKCDNRKCVNPSHLFIGNNFDNMKDCVLKGRHNPPKGSNVAVSKLKAHQVRKIKILYYSGKITNKVELGRMFNVTNAVIRYIVWGIWWRHVDSPYQIIPRFTRSSLADPNGAKTIAGSSRPM